MPEPEEVQDNGLDFDGLRRMVSWGIHQKKAIRKRGPVEKSCCNGGYYRGSPGRDIFFCLPRLSEKEIVRIAKIFGESFTRVPPSDHVCVAACIRFIYGQFNKQGGLMSDSRYYEELDRRAKPDGHRHKSRIYHMREEDPPDWSVPRHFLGLLAEEFKSNGNHYGLTILNEMEGHRLGDEALVLDSMDKLDQMELVYNEAFRQALKCESYKHMFTPFYWAARYFMKYGDKERAIKYSYKTLKYAARYCPDSRKSYMAKCMHCCVYILLNDTETAEKYLKGLLKKKTKKAVKDAAKRAMREIKKYRQ